VVVDYRPSGTKSYQYPGICGVRMILTKGSWENDSSSGFSIAATRASSCLRVWFIGVLLLGGFALSLIPALRFAPSVITGAAGCAFLFLARVLTMGSVGRKGREGASAG
jgi:hypothetical protein